MLYNDTLDRRIVGRGLGFGGRRSTTTAGRSRCGSRSRSCASRSRSAHVGHQRRALHPAQERERLAADGAEERERAGLARCRTSPGSTASGRRGTSSCCPTPRRAPSSSRRASRQPVQRRLAGVCRRRPRHEVGPHQQPHRSTRTINPDFGQVEVDPAVVNLTAFETFFDEKRPFFLEGAQIFNNFGTGGSNSFWGFNTSDPHIFYSRRIGRAPQLSARGRLRRSADGHDDPRRGEAHRQDRRRLEPRHARGGHRRGVARTGRPRRSAARRRSSRSPTTSSPRLQREIGAAPAPASSTTAVNRRLDTRRVPRRPRRARRTSSAATRYLFLDGSRDWVLTGKARQRAASAARTAFLQRLQRAPQRYFQRPDATHVELRSDADVAHRRHRPADAQSQQRAVAGERAAVGREPWLRVERPRLPRHRRPRGRARRLLLARIDARPPRARSR